MIDWKEQENEADKLAKTDAVNDSSRKFKLLPGDPKKGTRYNGKITAVDIEPISNKKTDNNGRDMLSLTVVVTSGTFKGFTETFTRVLNPVSIDRPSDTAVEKEVEKLMSTKNLSREDALDEFVAGWKKWRANYRRQTYTMFAKMGVDIDGDDDNEIIKGVAHSVGNLTEFTIYDQNGDSPRKKFLEFGKIRNNTEESTDATLFEALPSGDDLPID